MTRKEIVLNRLNSVGHKQHEHKTHMKLLVRKRQVRHRQFFFKVTTVRRLFDVFIKAEHTYGFYLDKINQYINTST